MNFTNVFDSDNMTGLHYSIISIILKRNRGDIPTINIDTAGSDCSSIDFYLSCAVCYIEETERRSLKIKTTRHLYNDIKVIE